MKNTIKNILKKELTDEDIISIYIYGSFIRDDYDDNESDIDVLIILKDNADIKKLKDKLDYINEKYSFNLEFTVVYEYEFKCGLHAGWSKYFYIALKQKSECVYGKDIIKKFNFEISFDEIHNKVIQLSQRLRNAIINKTKISEIEFWNKKYKKWIGVILSEFLYLHGILEISPKKAYIKFSKIYPEIKISINSSIEEKFYFLEKLRNLMIKMKLTERKRDGVAVILYKGNKFLLLKQKHNWKGWEFIKGGIKENETIIDATIREIKEEVGITNIEIKKVFPYKLSFKQISNKTLEARVYTTVLVEYLGNNKIKLEKNKFIDAKFFTLKQAYSKFKWKKYKDLFIRVVNDMKILGY